MELLTQSKKIKSFFILFVAIQGIIFVGNMTAYVDGSSTMITIPKLVVTVLELIAIFGFFFNKRILIQLFWKILFPVSIILNVIEFHRGVLEMLRLDTVGIPTMILTLLAIIIVYGPILLIQYYALYKYAFTKEYFTS